MKRFSLFELLFAVTLFAIGITSGWLTREYSWQSKLNAEAKELAATTITSYDFSPEVGVFSVRHAETHDLAASRQKQIFNILLKRNGIEFPNE